MRETYSIRFGPGLIASVKLTEGAGVWHIDTVHVPPELRGRGVSRRLLTRVLSDADRASVRLSLEARACGGLSQADLVNYYRRLGFRPTTARGTFGPVMVRRPVRRARSAVSRV